MKKFVILLLCGLMLGCTDHVGEQLAVEGQQKKKIRVTQDDYRQVFRWLADNQDWYIESATKDGEMWVTLKKR